MRSISFAATLTILFLLTSGAGWVGPAHAQEAAEEPEVGWSGSSELSLVATSGNSEAQTLGFRGSLIHLWKVGSLTFEAGALRAETTTISRVAIGSPNDFRILETSSTELTAENYFLRGRYDRPISERLFWYSGAGWERNEFAGIRNRYSVVGGIGHIWFDDEKARFRTDYGVTYTNQKDVFEVAGSDDSFLGLRLGWDYFRQLTSSTTYGNVLIADSNLDQTSDYRVDMTNWLAVAMSEHMALKVSLQMLYDNEPSLVGLPLLTPAGFLTGETVPGQLDELDSVLTVALVVSF